MTVDERVKQFARFVKCESGYYEPSDWSLEDRLCDLFYWFEEHRVAQNLGPLSN